MSESLDQKILDAYQELKTRDKVDQHLIHLNASIQQAEERIKWLDEDITKAGHQLEKRQNLEDSTMYRWFHSLFQNEEKSADEMEQENHQYYLKFMELKDMKQQRNIMLFEKKVLEEKKEKLKELDVQLKEMFHRKEYDLSEWSDQAAYRTDLMEEQENIFFQRELLKEMKEASHAAFLCQTTLKNLIKDIEQISLEEKISTNIQGHSLSKDKVKIAIRLKEACDFLGKHLRELNIQLKDISISLQIDYQRKYQYFERFTEDIYLILASFPHHQKRLDRLIRHLSHIQKNVTKILEKMNRDIEFSERSIKRSERKKELFILLAIKQRGQ